MLVPSVATVLVVTFLLIGSISGPTVKALPTDGATVLSPAGVREDVARPPATPVLIKDDGSPAASIVDARTRQKRVRVRKVVRPTSTTTLPHDVQTDILEGAETSAAMPSSTLNETAATSSPENATEQSSSPPSSTTTTSTSSTTAPATSTAKPTAVPTEASTTHAPRGTGRYRPPTPSTTPSAISATNRKSFVGEGISPFHNFGKKLAQNQQTPGSSNLVESPQRTRISQRRMSSPQPKVEEPKVSTGAPPRENLAQGRRRNRTYNYQNENVNSAAGGERSTENLVTPLKAPDTNGTSEEVSKVEEGSGAESDTKKEMTASRFASVNKKGTNKKYLTLVRNNQNTNTTFNNTENTLVTENMAAETSSVISVPVSPYEDFRVDASTHRSSKIPAEVRTFVEEPPPSMNTMSAQSFSPSHSGPIMVSQPTDIPDGSGYAGRTFERAVPVETSAFLQPLNIHYDYQVRPVARPTDPERTDLVENLKEQVEVLSIPSPDGTKTHLNLSQSEPAESTPLPQNTELVKKEVVTSISVKQPGAPEVTSPPSKQQHTNPPLTSQILSQNGDIPNLNDSIRIFLNTTQEPVVIETLQEAAEELLIGRSLEPLNEQVNLKPPRENVRQVTVSNTSEVSVVLPSSPVPFTVATTQPSVHLNNEQRSVIEPATKLPRYRSTTTTTTSPPPEPLPETPTYVKLQQLAPAVTTERLLIVVPNEPSDDHKARSLRPEPNTTTASSTRPEDTSVPSTPLMRSTSTTTTTTTTTTTQKPTTILTAPPPPPQTTTTTPQPTTTTTTPPPTTTTTAAPTPSTTTSTTSSPPPTSTSSTTSQPRAVPSRPSSNAAKPLSLEEIKNRGFKLTNAPSAPLPNVPIVAVPKDEFNKTLSSTSSSTSSSPPPSSSTSTSSTTTTSAPIEHRDPVILSAKNRGRVVSKQDFTSMEGALDNAKRIPTDRELGVAPGVGALSYVLMALGMIPLALVGVCTARYVINRRKKVLDESDSSSELSCQRRNQLQTQANLSSPGKSPRKLPHLPAWETSIKSPGEPVMQLPPTTSRWEFPRDKLRLQTVLGHGNFGQVWKAEADDISGHQRLTRLVAVKTVKESATAREREDLLRELAIMQQLGSHPNVVTLLGCCTEKEPCLLIMEYVMYGKLLTYLRDHRTRQDYYNFSEDSDALTSRDLTVFAYCVSRGMEYIASKGVIHRDLAARNVLVDHNKLCKIADFGMSRSVRDTDSGEVYEQRETKGALPIRWMAPESLHYSIFTHKSDVWSFGILLWEIVTLGSTPYCTMSAREVMRRVRDGYRLERPAHCRAELFRVVQRCWHADPAKRPDFGDLRRALADLLEDASRGGSYVDLEGLASEANKTLVASGVPGGAQGAVAALAANSRASSAEINI